MKRALTPAGRQLYRLVRLLYFTISRPLSRVAAFCFAPTLVCRSPKAPTPEPPKEQNPACRWTIGTVSVCASALRNSRREFIKSRLLDCLR